MQYSKTNTYHVFRFDGLANFQQYINERNAGDFTVSYNESKFKDHYSGKRLSESFTGTDSLDEVRDLTSYIYPERLKKLQKSVTDKIKALQVPDVRKRVKFSDRGEFVADRYFAGDRRKPFATRKSGRGMNVPTVNIYLSLGYNCNVDAKEQAPYNSLAGVIFADRLAKKGYAVNIYSVQSNQRDYNSKDVFLNIIQIKKSTNYLDADTLATIASDPRFFRYWGFLATASLWDDIEKRTCSCLGYSPDLQEVKRILQKTGTVDSFGNGKNFLFGKAFSESAVINQLQKAIHQIQNRKV